MVHGGDVGVFQHEQRNNEAEVSSRDLGRSVRREVGGQEAKRVDAGHAASANRHGPALAGELGAADATAGRRASQRMLRVKRQRAGYRISAGEAHDTAERHARLQAGRVAPYAERNNARTKHGKGRLRAVGGRPTKRPGSRLPQSRPGVSARGFGCGRQRDTLRKTKQRGLARVAGAYLFNMIGRNVARLPKLLAAQERADHKG